MKLTLLTDEPHRVGDIGAAAGEWNGRLETTAASDPSPALGPSTER